MKYYINKILEQPFEDVEKRLVELLKDEGFHVSIEMDMQEKFRQTLGVDFRRYKILGTCNPAFAHKAILAEDKIGTMLPCNIIIQELANGEVEVASIDPVASMLAVDNRPLKEEAEVIKSELQRVIDAL